MTNGNIVDGTHVFFHGLGLDVRELARLRDGGLAYGDLLKNNTVTVAEADTLLAVRELAAGGSAETEDWEMVWHILTAIEKRSHLHPAWLAKEKDTGLFLSPRFFRFSNNPFAVALRLASESLAFISFRFDAVARPACRDTLETRRAQQTHVQETLRFAVERVEEATVPQLRDQLIEAWS